MQLFQTETSNYIKKNLDENFIDWSYGWYKIMALSGSSVSFSIGHEFFNTKMELINMDHFWVTDNSEIEELIIKEFKLLNNIDDVNIFMFIFENRMFKELKCSWDQSIKEKFELYLPKSKKGKIKPWYKDNWIAPLMEKVAKTSDKYQILPLASIVFDTENLTYDKAFLELNKLVNFSNDTMWDGGHYNIKYCNETWTAEGGLYLYETIEDKEDNNVEEVSIDINLTEEIKTLFIFIQKEYAKFNPKVPFDSLFITVQFDSTFTRNFELNGVEVYPDAPPVPDVLDANYFMQNLFNCLVINAPANFEWAIYTITRKRLENGSTESSGKYYYTVNEDKSDLQVLNPGEEIFMMNVTERLMDEFLEKDLKDFETVVFHYDKKGKALFKVLKRSDFKW